LFCFFLFPLISLALLQLREKARIERTSSTTFGGGMSNPSYAIPCLFLFLEGYTLLSHLERTQKIILKDIFFLKKKDNQRCLHHSLFVNERQP
jgi:hypothetical protein